MIKDKSIFIKNIYYMLSYAFRVLHQSNYEYISTEAFDNIHNLFAAILSKGIGEQLKQGLYREYLNKTEEMASVRGKIEIQGTIKKRIMHKHMLSCEYDELTENNIYNQILKTVMLILLRHEDVKREYKSILKKEAMFFSDVDVINPVSIKWSLIRFQKNNQTYHILISLCRFIIQGMLLSTESGEYKLASFVNAQGMNLLYQKFLLEYFIKEYPWLSVRASQIQWALDDGVNAMLPVMQSDIMLSQGDTVLIIDAKYYTHTTQEQYGKHTIISDNLYQIFAYVKNKEKELENRRHTVSGMLLYARTDEAIQPDVSYQMSGNKISIKTLDLNCDFQIIRQQLNEIVETHFTLR